MKRLLYALLFSPITIHAQQSTITLKVKDGQGKEIKVNAPTKGLPYLAGNKSYVLNDAGVLQLEHIGGVYEIQYNKLLRLYVKPGVAYEVTLSNAGLQTNSSDEEGQQLLNKLPAEFYQKVAIAYYKADTVFAHNKKRVLQNADSVMAPYKALLAKGKIDKGLYTYAQRYTQYYYANVLAATLMQDMTKLVFNKDSVGYDAKKLAQMESYWKEIQSVADVKDPAGMTVSSYFWYMNFYNQWYLYFFKDRIKTGGEPKQDYWDKGGYSMIQAFYPEPMKEYLTASWIYFVAAESEFQPFIVDWYKDLKARYPNTPFAAGLAAEVAKVEDYHKKVGNEFSASHRFVEQPDAIANVAELAARFKGKTVYLDIWATWCGPCKAEFAYNDSLRAFFSKKNIDILYISIDRVQEEKQWKEMIKYYDLQGYHIRATGSLMDDVRKLFGMKGGGMAIPRYALIKDGKVVLNEAKAPSAMEDLFKQVEGYL